MSVSYDEIKAQATKACEELVETAKLQKGDFDSVIYSEYDEQFRAVATIVLLLLIAEVCIMESRNPLLRNVRLFSRKTNSGKNR